MKKILISGYFGFGNFGDEWLLKTLLKLLNQFGEKKYIYVLYNIKNILEVTENVYYIPRWNFKEIIKYVIISETVFFCGGVFQDQSSIFSFFYYFLILTLAKIFKKRAVLISSEFVINKLPKFLQKFLVKNIDLIFLRNKKEFSDIKKLIDKEDDEKIHYCPDICFYEVEFKKEQVICRQIKNIGLILKKINKEKNRIIDICRLLSENYKVIFIPFHLKEDYMFCLDISKEIKNCEVRVWDRIENYKYIFQDIDFVISSRLHGIVVSIILKIPFLCISQDKKLKDFIADINRDLCCDFKSIKEKILKDRFFLADYEVSAEYTQNILEVFKFLASKEYI